MSYETVRALHPALDGVDSIHLFVDYALEIEADGSTLDALGSAYELVWSRGLMPSDASNSDLADAAAALTIAVATQNAPGLLETLVAER